MIPRLLRSWSRSPPFRATMASLKVALFCHVFWSYGYCVGLTSGPSMLPTFLVTGQSVVVSKRHRRGRDVRVGDCVVYSIPVDPTQEGLKRVLGMPGDYVLLNSPDCASSSSMIQVPKGHCFIVGDNLSWSRDSRDYGPLPLALVKGKAIAKCHMTGWNPLRWFSPMESGLRPVGQS